MAVGLRGLFRLNLGLANSLLSKSNFVNVGIRFIYTDKDLGIMGYENTRFIFRNQFVSIEDTFRVKMKEICKKEDGVIFTEDLKAMIHLAQANEEDLELVTEMLKKYVQDKSRNNFQSYVFGPVVMRMFYYLNEPQKALSVFTNPQLTDTLMYHTSFKILLCLLYKHQMYDELRSVYDTVEKVKGKEFTTSGSVLAYAACLKQNTPEAVQYALQNWKEHSKVKLPLNRATAIVAYLLIKHNICQEALEMLAVTTRESMSIRCLKILAYMRLGRYLQIIPILKYSSEQDLSLPHRFGFYADVMYELIEKLKQEDVPEREDILYLIDKLKQQHRIETEKTLEEFLLRPLLIRSKTEVREGTFLNRKRQGTDLQTGLKSSM